MDNKIQCKSCGNFFSPNCESEVFCCYCQTVYSMLDNSTSSFNAEAKTEAKTETKTEAKTEAKTSCIHSTQP